VVPARQQGFEETLVSILGFCLVKEHLDFKERDQRLYAAKVGDSWVIKVYSSIPPAKDERARRRR